MIGVLAAVAQVSVRRSEAGYWARVRLTVLRMALGSALGQALYFDITGLASGQHGQRLVGDGGVLVAGGHVGRTVLVVVAAGQVRVEVASQRRY